MDVTVSANALYGITNGILSGLATTEVLEDPEIQVRGDSSVFHMSPLECGGSMAENKMVFEVSWTVVVSLFPAIVPEHVHHDRLPDQHQLLWSSRSGVDLLPLSYGILLVRGKDIRSADATSSGGRSATPCNCSNNQAYA